MTSNLEMSKKKKKRSDQLKSVAIKLYVNTSNALLV